MKYHVLLVEDDEVDVMMVKRAFAKVGRSNHIYLASDGLEALDILKGENGKERAERPIVILLDVNMPRMNGLEFLEQLRQETTLKFLPVIVLSSSKRDQDVCAAYHKQVAGYFVKPIHIEDLVSMMTVMDQYWSASQHGTRCDQLTEEGEEENAPELENVS